MPPGWSYFEYLGLAVGHILPQKPEFLITYWVFPFLQPSVYNALAFLRRIGAPV